MSTALRRGRTLDKKAVEHARGWRNLRLALLNAKIESGTMLALTRRERHEWRRLTGLMHP